MKNYTIFYEVYPFNAEDMDPKRETVEAESLNEAFEKVYEIHGKDTIEIFKKPAVGNYKHFIQLRNSLLI